MRLLPSLCLGLLLVAGGPGLAAAPLAPKTLAVVKEAAFLPATFYVGEEVEALLYVSLEGPEVKPFSLKQGDGLAPPDPRADPEIRSLSLTKGREGWELRIRFVPWSPGKASLPGITAQGLSLLPLPYEVASSLRPEDRDPSPPKPQLDPPGTSLYLYGFVALVLLLGLLVFASAAWLIPGALRLLARRRAAQARLTLERSLAWLRKEVRRSRPEDFYAALARAFRVYLSVRVLPEAPALTPREFLAWEDKSSDSEGQAEALQALGLQANALRGKGLWADAAALLAEADEVRFAGLGADEAMMARALATAGKLGDAVEEALGDSL